MELLKFLKLWFEDFNIYIFFVQPTGHICCVNLFWRKKCAKDSYWNMSRHVSWCPQGTKKSLLLQKHIFSWNSIWHSSRFSQRDWTSFAESIWDMNSQAEYDRLVKIGKLCKNESFRLMFRGSAKGVCEIYTVSIFTFSYKGFRLSLWSAKFATSLLVFLDGWKMSLNLPLFIFNLT